MPRYFFHIYDGIDVIDKTGTVLAGKREMRIHMISLASGLFNDQAAFKDGMWQMEAVDEDGSIVGTMEFGLNKKSRR